MYLKDKEIPEYLIKEIETRYIKDINNLENHKYKRVIEREMLGKYYPGAIEGLAQLDDNVYNEMEKSGLLEKFLISNLDFQNDSLIIPFDIELNVVEAEDIQKIGSFALNVKKINKSSISELSDSEIKLFLELLINTGYLNIRYHINILKTLVGNSIFIPQNKDEYYSLITWLKSSIIHSSKAISDNTKQKFYEVINNIDNINSEFKKYDFTKKNIKISVLPPPIEKILK